MSDNAEINIYKMTPRQTRRAIERCIMADGLVPFVKSSPGMGKSSIFRQIARDFKLWLIDHRLSTSAPEDLSGLPEFYTDADGQRRARFVPFDMFPVAMTRIPENYEGWMLFLDEANAGTKMVQAASYKLVLDNYVGQFPLHERVRIGMAGNLMTDRAIVNPLSTAMQSRVIHIDMILSHLEWLEDVALKEQYDERIIAYLMFDEDELMTFRPDHEDNTFNCPRTWEFMNKLIKDHDVVPEDAALFAGTISAGSAPKFIAFCEVQKEIATIADVLRDPTGLPIPQDNQGQWIMISHLMAKANKDNFDKIAQYINRFGLSFQVLFFRGVKVRQPQLRTHPSYVKAMVSMAKYLNEDPNLIAA